MRALSRPKGSHMLSKLSTREHNEGNHPSCVPLLLGELMCHWSDSCLRKSDDERLYVLHSKL